MVTRFSELPPVMRERAKWARKQILKQTRKKSKYKIQVDEDELLAWVYHPRDRLWYSINGNYSRTSPKDKMKRRKFYEKRQTAWQEKAEEIAVKRLAEQRYWSEVRKRILERDGYTCQSCKKKIGKFEVHHIQKKRLGGGDYDDNLITVCRRCHRKVEKWSASS